MNSIDAEKALIASLLHTPAALAEVQLTDAEFQDPSMAVVFRTMQDIAEAGYPPSVPALKARLGGNDYGFGDLRSLEGYAFGGRMPQSADLARVVREAAQRRALRLICADLAQNIDNPQVDVRRLVQDASSAMQDCTNLLHGDAEVIGGLADFKADMLDLLHGDRGIICPIGIPDLDKALGGWQKSNYLVMGARPGMGKSTASVDFSLRTARRGVGVLVFSLEMSARVTWLRMLSALTKLNNHAPSVDYKTLMHGKETTAQKNSAASCLANLQDMPLSVIHPKNKTVEGLMVEAQKVAKAMEAEGYKLGLIIVDHMGKMTSSSKSKNQNKTNEVGEISNGLANLSRAMDLQVVACSQLNRASVQGDNKRPDLTALRNSGDIEQDADVVIFLHREEYYLEQAGEPTEAEERAAWQAEKAAWAGIMEILISKSRNGEVGIARVGTDMGHSLLTPLGNRGKS